MVKARELHPIQLDSDLSLEDWGERFARQAHLESAEKLHEAIVLTHRLERADETAIDWRDLMPINLVLRWPIFYR